METKNSIYKGQVFKRPYSPFKNSRLKKYFFILKTVIIFFKQSQFYMFS